MPHQIITTAPAGEHVVESTLVGMTPTARIAAQYAAGGWPVFPCAYGCKSPLGGSHGHLDATTDLEKIRELFGQRPRLNIAVACEPAGIVVVDVDVRNHGDETIGRLQSKHGPLPDTARVISGSRDGSQHFYFAAVEGARYPTKLGDGVDVKHAGGYVLLPPSTRRPEDGRRQWTRYTWDAAGHINDGRLAYAPPWIAAGVTGVSAPQAHPRRDAVAPAAESFLAVAFREAGLLGSPLAGGRIAVRCPWADQHTDGRGRGTDSSTVLLPPTTDDRLGALSCAHSHCAGRREVDVIAVLPRHAIARAAARYPRALGRLAWRAARRRQRAHR